MGTHRDKIARTIIIPALLFALALTPQSGYLRKASAAFSYNVSIVNLGFTPQNLTVHTGDTVTWTNNDPLLYELYFQYTNGTSLALSPFLQPGDTYSLRFTTCRNVQYVTISSLTTAVGNVRVLLQGDVNGDGNVNIIDLATVGSQFGKTIGMPGFKPAADLNNDGVIDIVDLVLVARPFGNHCV